MTLKEIVAEFGVSVGTAHNLRAQGMPEELEEARSWYALRSVRKGRPRTPKPVESYMMELGGDELEGTIESLRMVERSIAETLRWANKEKKVAEATILRREHVAAIKAIYDAEVKVIKIREIRGRLFSADRCLNMINGAIQAATLVLRRLPELGKTPEERKRLEAFMNSVLNEFKTGAADGLKHAA